MPKVPLHFILNGEEKAEFIDSGITVLRLLREKMGDLTPKAGCLQGTCGSCTVLIDGEPRLACITLAEDCDGAELATVAGLASNGRLHPLQQAFIDHFAAQCGFCTPGMLIAAQALLTRTPNPSREDVLDALSGNICRCTGYEPIVRAVLAAAETTTQAAPAAGSRLMEIRKSYFADERNDDLREIGQGRQRSDVLGHTQGITPFYADRTIPGLLHLRMVRSPHHHARITSIDTSAAERHPGVRRVITAKDVPHNVYTVLSLINIGPEDEPVLAFDKVRWMGEPVVAIVADSERSAYEAAALVRIEYDELPAVFDVEDALQPGAPLVNEYHGQNYYRYDSGQSRKVILGDVEKGFAAADHILEQRYDAAPIEQAPTETTGCIVVPDQNNRFTCYTGTQAVFFTLDNSSIILDVPGQRLHFVGGTAGGGFGGKVDCTTEPIAILAAMLTGKPVSFVYNRYEEMQISSPRAAERIYLKDGVMKDGRIVARQVRCYVDAGAYSRHTPYGTQKAAAHFPGPYTIPNVLIDCFCVYTNRTPSSAMRGFGVTIGDFALEVQMDKLARLIGMDPLEFRFINAYRDGDMKAHHQPTEGAALIECMQEAAIWANWPVDPRFLAMSSREPRGDA